MSKVKEFAELIQNSWKKRNSLLCVGLDPRSDQIPEPYRSEKNGILAYCQEIVMRTYPYVCAYKPNVAFFSALGLEDQLTELIRFIHQEYADIPVVLDAKRGDIGSTARFYVDEVTQRYGADAVTVSPFLGWDCVEPFIEASHLGVFVLCRTSNAGSDWLQRQKSDKEVFRLIAERVDELTNPNVGLVVGATHAVELQEIRQITPNTTFLIPGVGAQGAKPEEVLDIARAAHHPGMLVNASRGILQQTEGKGYFDNVAENARSFASQLVAYPP